MGKETKVGLLVGMCFIVCCAIVLSHHGRRRAEAQDLSVTNAERSREAPLLLDRSASAERATKRIAPKRTSNRDNRRTTSQTPLEDEQDTQLADAESAADPRSQSATRGSEAVRSGTMRSGFERTENREARGRTAEPFIHRGPPIPDVVASKTSLINRRGEEERVVLDDESDDSDPLVANIPSRDRQDGLDQTPSADDRAANNRRTLTSTPSPAPTNHRDSQAGYSSPTRSESDAIEQARRSEGQRFAGETERAIDRPARPTRAAMDRHVVQDGENLSRIAEQYYGSSDPTILDAIVKANDETMSGPNHIISGQELLLPEIPGIESIRRAESAQWATSEADADPRQTYGDPKQTYGVDDKIESNERTTAEPKIVAEYEVQPGDLLSRVVSRHYGSASKQIVDAVYQANKTRMKSPDALVAGTVIVLPEIAGVRPNGLDEKSHQRDEPLAPSPSTQESFRWYVVKKGDTYSKIAAAEMGTSKRWEELAEFNKNVFAKATQIRHGVRIRIPTTTPSDDTTGSSRRGR